MRLSRTVSFLPQLLTDTRDYALYDPSLTTATNGSKTPASQDYPTILSIGKSFFESYQTWPNVKYSHGFNLGKNGTAGHDTLVATVPLACQALSGGKLAYWELGNEPDLFKTSAQGIVRPSSWNESDYVTEWLEGTRLIKSLVAENCPDEPYSYMAPSFAGTHNSLDPVRTWHAGLDTDQDIALISSHKYDCSPPLPLPQRSSTNTSTQLHRRRHPTWGNSPTHSHEP